MATGAVKRGAFSCLFIYSYDKFAFAEIPLNRADYRDFFIYGVEP